jgi:hypothetical protein
MPLVKNQERSPPRTVLLVIILRELGPTVEWNVGLRVYPSIRSTIDSSLQLTNIARATTLSLPFSLLSSAKPISFAQHGIYYVFVIPSYDHAPCDPGCFGLIHSVY